MKERTPSFLNTAEVAALIGTSKQTLLNWLRAGSVMEPLRNPANNYRLWTEHDIASIREMLRERRLAENRNR